MMNKIIRNKNRFNRKKQVHYQPEYVKLNIDPVCVDRNIRESFNMNRRIPFVAGNSSNTNSELKNNDTDNNKVFISGHSCSSITNGNVFTSNNDLLEEADKINKQQFKFDDVDLPVQQNDVPEETNDVMPTDVNDGEYCIILNNTIVYTSSSMDDIENIIEEILFNRKSAKFGDIVVFKRMKVKIGVSIL